MKTDAAKPLTIGIVVQRKAKAQRDKLSGVLRFAVQRPRWNVIILDEMLPAQTRFDGVIRLSHLSRIVPPGSGSKPPPTVAVDSVFPLPPNVPNVMIDNLAIGEAAAELFLQRGLSHFAAVQYTGKGNDRHSTVRIDGFVRRLRRDGFSVARYRPRSMRENEFLCGSDRFRQWLADLPKPCGLFAFYDRQARDILDACRLAHLSIPDQVLLIGVDNETEICEVTQPSLSSIFPNFESAGYLAAETLDRMLGGRRVKRFRSYGIKTLVERESTLALKTDARLVAAALKLMNEANDHTIAVAEIARLLHVSQSLLNLRFNEVLGHGPKEELNRLRQRQIETLLMDPSLSVAEIAQRGHFAYPEQLYRFFRIRTGMSATVWRTTVGKHRSNAVQG